MKCKKLLLKVKVSLYYVTTCNGFWLDSYFVSEDGLCCKYFDEVFKKRSQC
jgi:hypothetical protein